MPLNPAAKVKLTISTKRRLSNGDEIFIAPGIELDCSPDEMDEKQAEVSERIHAWMESELEAFPDAELEDEDEDEEDADEDEEDADEDEEGDEDEDGEEDWPTEAEIRKMPKAKLQELAEEAEIELEGTTVKAMRDELIEILHGDEEEDEEGDEDDEDDEDDEEEADLTEDDIKAMDLEELQELCEDWEIGHPKLKKGLKLAAKKAAYVKHVLANAEE